MMTASLSPAAPFCSAYERWQCQPPLPTIEVFNAIYDRSLHREKIRTRGIFDDIGASFSNWSPSKVAELVPGLGNIDTSPALPWARYITLKTKKNERSWRYIEV